MSVKKPDAEQCTEEILKDASKQGDVRLAWKFDPKKSMAHPFHEMIAKFGSRIVLDLDEIVLEPPAKAAAKATRIYQGYAERLGQPDPNKTREVMAHFANSLKASQQLESGVALLPEEAVFKGIDNRAR